MDYFVLKVTRKSIWHSAVTSFVYN